MGKSTQPLLKRCKALGINPIVMGYGKVSKRNQKETRRKISEYGLQLKEKQKVKFIYGIMEKQFHRYYVMATKKHGVAGEMLLQLLESRIDNVIFRMGFSKTRDEARQMVSHGHILVNGKKVDIPSYNVKPGDTIAIKEASKDHKAILASLESINSIPAYVTFDKKNMEGTYVRYPERNELSADINEAFIVEFYNR
jgi:small subunit ribosomal protein S4